MEVNEMKGVDDLPFAETPFHRGLSAASVVEKRHSHVMETKMMMTRREAGGDHDHRRQYGLRDEQMRLNVANDPPSSCRFDRAMIFPTMITQAPTSSVFSPNSASCYSNNDTVLDGGELEVHPQQLTIIAERKLRRMISNRESARRSRMRKKKQIEELQYQVGQLEGSNRQLSEKLIQLLECNQQILHENAELKRKVSSLQIILTDFLTPLRNLEDVFCNSNRVRAEASNSSHHLPS